jgi:hypothetical protein
MAIKLKFTDPRSGLDFEVETNTIKEALDFQEQWFQGKSFRNIPPAKSSKLSEKAPNKALEVTKAFSDEKT